MIRIERTEWEQNGEEKRAARKTTPGKECVRVELFSLLRANDDVSLFFLDSEVLIVRVGAVVVLVDSCKWPLIVSAHHRSGLTSYCLQSCAGHAS